MSQEHPSDPQGGPRAGTDTGAGRSWRWALGGVLALALLLRVVYVLQSRSSPLFGAPQMDAEYHLAWARAFAAGERFLPGEPFYRAPLYSWFLGCVLALFGDGLLAPRLVQAGLGTCTVGLTFLVGRRAFGPWTGVLAALGAATSWTLIYFDGELLIPTLAIPLQLCALWLSLRLTDDRRPAALLGAGAAWGLAAIARPTVLLIVPWVALWVLLRPHGVPGEDTSAPIARRLPAALMILLGFALPVLPVTTYNLVGGGDRVLISSTAGVNLWIGNHPGSDGSSARLPGARTDLWGGIEDAARMAKAESGSSRDLRPSEISSHFAGKAREHILQHPAEALAHFAWKLRLTYCAWELGNNTDPRFFARRFGPVTRFLPLGFGLLAPLGLVGFLLITRSAWRLFPLWLFLPAQTAAVVLFFSNARFRLPLVPVLCVLGAHVLVCAWQAWRARAWPQLGIGAALVAGLGWMVHQIPEAVDRSDASGLHQLGVLAMIAGDVPGGAAYFEESVAANPRYPYAHRDLGAAARELGRLDDAERHLEIAWGLLPGDLQTLLHLAELYAADPSRGDLCTVAQRMAEVAPEDPETFFNLGRCASNRAQAKAAAGASEDDVRAELARARAAFQRALLLRVDFANAYLLGEAHLALEEFEEAERAFAEAERQLPAPDPGGYFWKNHTGRVRSLRGAGRQSDAVRHAEDLWRRFQSDPTQRDAARSLLQTARRGD